MGYDNDTVFMGIDVGTQSVRVGFFNMEGTLVALATEAYPTEYPRPGWAEQNPLDWWKGTCKATRECLYTSGIRPSSIHGISFDATSATVLMVDKEGIPFDKAILWMDQRAVKEAEDVLQTNHPYLKYVGGQDSVEWMVPKALWLKRNKPDLFKHAFLIIEATDWIAFKLTGQWTVSQCNATCKWNYVSREGGWSREFFSALGFPEILSKWPEQVVPMGEKIGTLTPKAAEELGLPSGIPVAEGGIDAYVGMFGLNALDSNILTLILGSSSVVFALQDQAVFSKSIWGPYQDAVLQGKWLIEGGQTSSGSIINWLVDNISALVEGGKTGKQDLLTRLDTGIERIPPGSEGLVLLDYWQGNRTPRRDPKAKGVIFGLTVGHDFYHLMRSIYEGVSFGTKHILQTFKENGIHINRASVGGGGTKSQKWLELTADICELEIIVPRYADSCGILGSAILAAYGAQAFPSLTEAATAMMTVEYKIQPSGSAENYSEAYTKYLALYEATKHLL